MTSLLLVGSLCVGVVLTRVMTSFFRRCRIGRPRVWGNVAAMLMGGVPMLYRSVPIW